MDHISQIQRLRGICKEQVEDGFREALLRANSFRQRQARLLQRRGIITYLPRFPRASPETNRVVTRVILVFSDNLRRRFLCYRKLLCNVPITKKPSGQDHTATERNYFPQHQFLPTMKNLCFSSINKEQLLPFLNISFGKYNCFLCICRECSNS